jgi:hypothetical protein
MPSSHAAAKASSPHISAWATYWMPSRVRPSSFRSAAFRSLVSAVQPQEIERAGNRLMFKAAGVQSVKVGPAVLVSADHFAIELRVSLEAAASLTMRG